MTDVDALARQAGAETGECFPADTPWRRRFVELVIEAQKRGITQLNENSALRMVWMLTTGSGQDGDEWNVESIHSTEDGAQRALELYQEPQQNIRGGTYVRDAQIEEWEIFK